MRELFWIWELDIGSTYMYRWSRMEANKLHQGILIPVLWECSMSRQKDCGIEENYTGSHKRSTQRELEFIQRHPSIHHKPVKRIHRSLSHAVLAAQHLASNSQRFNTRGSIKQERPFAEPYVQSNAKRKHEEKIQQKCGPTPFASKNAPKKRTRGNIMRHQVMSVLAEIDAIAPCRPPCLLERSYPCGLGLLPSSSLGLRCPEPRFEHDLDVRGS